MSNVVLQIGPSWCGLATIKRLVIFGDSYSAVGAPIDTPRTATQPLGVPFPGPGCFTDYDGTRRRQAPNWVGHFLVTYAPEPRFRDLEFDPNAPEKPGRAQAQDPAYERDPVLVYDYARGGKMVADVVSQIVDQFLPLLGAWRRERAAEGSGKGGDAAKEWTSENALFVTWVGINDCAFASTRDAREAAFQQLFAAQDELYRAGARNFLFIDVPHINRSPAVPLSHKDKSERYDEWNEMLLAHARQFAVAHPDATILLFSSARTLDRILDDPDVFGFPAGDVREPFGSIWRDQLHPTGAVHDIFAMDIAEFLGGVAAGV
ncbi:hypothetical protein HDZ31DRAFT_45745 [Schizophyllum fasciatum]